MSKPFERNERSVFNKQATLAFVIVLIVIIPVIGLFRPSEAEAASGESTPTPVVQQDDQTNRSGTSVTWLFAAVAFGVVAFGAAGVWATRKS